MFVFIYNVLCLTVRAKGMHTLLCADGHYCDTELSIVDKSMQGQAQARVPPCMCACASACAHMRRHVFLLECACLCAGGGVLLSCGCVCLLYAIEEGLLMNANVAGNAGKCCLWTCRLVCIALHVQQYVYMGAIPPSMLSSLLSSDQHSSQHN
jgi:hypothetical protein